MAGSPVNDITESGAPLAMGDHMITVYSSQGQKRAILVPFLAAGVLLNQQVMVIAEYGAISGLREELEAADIDTASVLASQQLIFLGEDDLPVRRYNFEDRVLLDFLLGATESARSRGWSALRVAAEWPWFVNDIDMAGVLRYESRVTSVFRQYPAVLMCLYDMSQLQPGTVTDLVSTHPLVVLGDRVVENDLYVPLTGTDAGVSERLN